jgi:phosphotriesterase-related protein
MITRPARTGEVQTVLGPVPPDHLGITLPHEHLLIDQRPYYREPEGASARGRGRRPIGLLNHHEFTNDWTLNLDDLHILDEATAIEEIECFRREGGGAVVDVTPVGLGRDPVGLQRIARATGLHVIMGAGYYTDQTLPADMMLRDEDTLAREMAGEITDGVGATGVRAGLIGEIGCSWPPTRNELKVLRAAAAAARQTGAPLMIHPGPGPDAPAGHLEVVRQAGLDAYRVIMAHIDHTTCDRERLRSLAETGCYLAYDHFGKEVSHFPSLVTDAGFEMLTDAGRVREILWLLEHGYGRQVHLSQDIAIKVKLTRYGGFGYAHLLRRVVPRLRRAGLTDADLKMLLVDNPARALTFA